MGYIQSTLEAVDKLIASGNVKSVCDLGDQFNYTGHMPAPYMSEWYRDNGITNYMSIDLNGKNDSKQWDLCEPVKTNKRFDLVVNAGTLEHVKDLYQGFANVDKLTKVGGYMLHENPKASNWPLHGFHYFDEKFYIDLAIQTGYTIIEIKNTVAAHNYDTGNNVFCLMIKMKDGFIEREQFPTTYTE